MSVQPCLAASKTLCRSSKMFIRMFALLCTLAPFLSSPARAQSGGHWGVSFQVNGSTYDSGVTTPWQAPPATTNNSNAVAYSTSSNTGGGVSSGGTITIVFTWQPSSPGAPPPSSVPAVIYAQAIARGTVDGGSANDGFGDTDVKTNTGASSTGTHNIAYPNSNLSGVVTASYNMSAQFINIPAQMSAGVSMSVTAN